MPALANALTEAAPWLLNNVPLIASLGFTEMNYYLKPSAVGVGLSGALLCGNMLCPPPLLSKFQENNVAVAWQLGSCYVPHPRALPVLAALLLQ